METTDYPRGLTFEQVWASIQELRESQKETERFLRETAERQREGFERLREADERRREADERLAKEAEERRKAADERLAKETEERKKEAEERRREADERLAKEAEERKKEAEERKKESERLAKEAEERKKEAEERKREMDAYHKETERIVRRNSRQMGDLHRRFGQLAEHLVAPNIHKRFNELGHHFGSYSPGGHKIYDYQTNETLTEIDLLLENGGTIMAVEVKTTPKVNDIEHHIRRIEILRDYRRKINDNRKVQGAIAGAIFGDEEKKATLEAGLYVIEQSGDTMKIGTPEGFVPREW